MKEFTSLMLIVLWRDFFVTGCQFTGNWQQFMLNTTRVGVIVVSGITDINPFDIFKIRPKYFFGTDSFGLK